jgi:DNA polymerase-4
MAPVVQAASIDEFYLDLTGTERLFRGESLPDTAWRIREEVLRRTDISVSIGGGTRRVIAKLATSHAKPAGVHIVPPGEEEAFLRTLELADIPGVGPALLAGLKERGLVRVADALDVQEEWFQRWFGERRGRWLWRRIRGLDDSEVNPDEVRKSISSERTFSRDLQDDEELERRLLRLAGSVGGTLRSKGFRARTVTVKLRDSDFRTRQHSRTLPEPVASDHGIWEVARTLFRELRSERGLAIRLIGVGLSSLVEDDAPLQLGLFAGDEVPWETERDRAVSRAVDRLRDRFGDAAVQPGRILEDPPGPGRDDEQEDDG